MRRTICNDDNKERGVEVAQGQNEEANTQGASTEAERLLLLAVLFENANRPISSSYIRDNVYGYCASDESARKAFMRDRKKLVLCGLLISQVSTSSGERRWSIDSNASYSDEHAITSEDAMTLNVACAPLANDPAFPYSNELRVALSKIDRSFSESPFIKTNSSIRDVSSVQNQLEAAAANGQPVRVSYIRADGTRLSRTLGICGFFPLSNNTYLVAQDLERASGGTIHSYNLARVTSATPIKRASYEPPNDFDITDYVKLPFQIGQTQYVATFRLPECVADSFSADTMGKGMIYRDDASDVLIWKVEVSSTQHAAEWAIAHAIQPIEPNVLRNTWVALLEESLSDER